MLHTFRREQLWESLKVRLQSARVDRAAWGWRAPSGSLKKAATFSSRAGGRRRSMKPSHFCRGTCLGCASNLDDLARLFDTVKREKGKIDVLFASAGKGEAAKLGEITEQHFDKEFGLIVRGTLSTVQKALPLLNDGASIIMTGSVASVKGFPGFGVYAASKAALRSFARDRKS